MNNIISNRVLMSKVCAETKVKVPTQRYIYLLLDEVNQQLQQQGGDRSWLVDTETGASCNISQIEGITRRVASGLTKLGFGPGDVIQTGYSNCLDFYWPVFAAWLCGGTVSAADPNLAPDLIKYQLNDTNAKVVVCSLEFVEKYSSLINKMLEPPLLFVLDAGTETILPGTARSFMQLLADGGEDAPTHDTLPEFDPTELQCVIFWTSGTTGTPKGIVHSHQSFYNCALSSSSKYKRMMMTTVGFHVGGFLLPLSTGIFKHKSIYFIKEKCFTAQFCLDMITKYEVEYLVCGINHFIKIGGLPKTNQQYPSLLGISPAGGAVSPGISEKVLQLLGPQTALVETYGSTELGFVSYCRDPTFEWGRLGSILPGVKVYFADLKTGEKVGPGQPGKIMVKTHCSLLEYLNRPRETTALFDEDRFGFIGDVGHYDETGNIYYDYRQKDLLKVDNYWFGPGEIESMLEGNDEIEEAMVWGEYDPGSGNDLVHVALVFTTTQVWPEQRVRDYVAERLPLTRRITGRIDVLKELPHSRQGKKLRRELKDHLTSN